VAMVRRVLVEAAAEGPRVRRRRARTRLLGDGDRAAVVLYDLATVGGDGPVVDGESDGGGERHGGVEVDTRWRGRSLVVMVAHAVMTVKFVVEERGGWGSETGASGGSEG
jgi:hypothetical protein